MQGTLKIVIALLLCLAATMCTSPTDYQPAWALNRPVEEGYLYGVGTCGKAYTSARARTLAVQRAMGEIAFQATGRNDYEFRFKEESDDGTLTVDAVRQGRTIHVLEGVEVVDEILYPGSEGWYDQDRIYVLVRIPRTRLPW
jgi:hypothetical protein